MPPGSRVTPRSEQPAMRAAHRFEFISQASWSTAMRTRLVLAMLVLLLGSVAVHAQSNEFAAEASGLLTASPYDPGAGVGFQLNYAHRFAHVPLVSIYGEIPFV